MNQVKLFNSRGEPSNKSSYSLLHDFLFVTSAREEGANVTILLTFFPNVFGVNIRNFYSRDFF
jgi:hypothetical protein